MKITELRVGMKVRDRWWSVCPGSCWGTGTIKKVLKTRVYVKYRRHVQVYDIPHLQFLDLSNTV